MVRAQTLFLTHALSLSLYIYIYIYREREREMWSYASHSTCCGYCVRDYHISFRLFALSNPSVPTLCLKDPWRRVDTLQPNLLLTVRWYERLDCLATQRKKKTRCLSTTKKSFLLKHVFETINNKQTRIVFQANRRRKNIERGRVTMRWG